MGVYYHLNLSDDDLDSDSLARLIKLDRELERVSGGVAFFPGDDEDPEAREEEPEAIFTVTGEGLMVKQPSEDAIGKLAHMANHLGATLWCDHSEDGDEDLEECMSYYPRGLVLPEAKKPKRVSTKPVPYSARDSYQVGQVVEHKTFGRGEVTRSAGKQVTIRFEEQGTKVLAQKLS
ncbi:MAG TPA: hypothetical protein DEA08_33560 [Planctomycetes bacterium]|nr:hypothetical protein [Planctomycetota bacterium]